MKLPLQLNNELFFSEQDQYIQKLFYFLSALYQAACFNSPEAYTSAFV